MIKTLHDMAFPAQEFQNLLSTLFYYPPSNVNIENIVLTILVVIKKFRLPNKKFSVLDNNHTI